MEFFKKLFQKSQTRIYSPVKGTIVELSTVKDETFAQEILGKGVAIIPSDGKFYAPASGTLETMFRTGHAYSIITSEDVEMLVHIGFDTVKLAGEHFTVHATEGQKVRKGDLLVEADLEKIKAAGYDVTTPIIILDPDSYSDIIKSEGDVNPGDPILTLKF